MHQAKRLPFTKDTKTKWEIVLANLKSNKGLMSKIYKDCKSKKKKKKANFKMGEVLD